MKIPAMAKHFLIMKICLILKLLLLRHFHLFLIHLRCYSVDYLSHRERRQESSLRGNARSNRIGKRREIFRLIELPPRTSSEKEIDDGHKK